MRVQGLCTACVHQNVYKSPDCMHSFALIQSAMLSAHSPLPLPVIHQSKVNACAWRAATCVAGIW